jgi:ribosome biogenesis GTPase
MKQQGLVINSHGRFFNVEANGKVYQSTAKGKKTEFVVGDIVAIDIINDSQASITDLVPRNNLIYRSDHYRSKIIASNLSQLLIVIAVKPNFNIGFLDSCLICAESSAIKPVIVINKMDLPESAEFAQKLTGLYANVLGYEIIRLSALNNCEQLDDYLKNQRTLLIGQSGVGKSTITNQICPEANAKTGEIAKYETSGRHTTTHATLYHIDENSDLIDCPGLQEFGLYHLEIDKVAWYFPEIRDHLGNCKFHNCLHLNEPGCQIKTMLNENLIDSNRYAFYCRLVNNLKTKKNY